MARKLVIQNIVQIPVKFDIDDNGKLLPYEFSITCKRISSSECKERTQAGFIYKDFVESLIMGWAGQTLVVEDDGTPAVYDAESLAMMFEVSGVAKTLAECYLNNMGARESKEKN